MDDVDAVSLDEGAGSSLANEPAPAASERDTSFQGDVLSRYLQEMDAVDLYSAAEELARAKDVFEAKNAVSEMYRLDGTIPYSEPGRVNPGSSPPIGSTVLPLPAPIPKKNPPRRYASLDRE